MCCLVQFSVRVPNSRKVIRSVGGVALVTVELPPKVMSLAIHSTLDC